MNRIASSIFFYFLLLVTTARSFCLSGVAPRDFRRGDELQLKVNKLLSTKILLPYDYYFLRYCKPSKIENLAENMGEVLRGDRNSFYMFHMREQHHCRMACRIVLNAQGAKDFKEKIDDEYRVNMIMDDLPVVVSRPSLDGNSSKIYEQGFRVGFKGESEVYKYFIFNHLSFIVMYNRDEETDGSRIVGFEVTPNSIKHEFDWRSGSMTVTTCNTNTRNMIGQSVVPPQEIAEGEEITFSYDVIYKESGIEWGSRWNAYLLMNDDQIYWFPIVNSLLIMLLLCGVVATVMIRTLYQDIASYNQLESGDEDREETGWRLIHGDVFRPPSNLEMACVCVGSGVQILGTILVMMIFTFLGFLFPSNRRFLMSTMVLLWLLVSFISGYFSSRLYRMFDTTEWKRSALKSALLIPSVLLSLFFALSALVWGENMALAVLWFGVSAPLMFLGGYFGFKKAAVEAPVETYKIPREIPKQPWYLNPVLSVLIGGILPFVAVLGEFRFIQTFAWMNRFSYLSGFLLVVFAILMIMCAEIAVVLCYLQLRSEDYKWWWRAFLNGGSSALYLFVYSVFYLFTELGFCASAIVYSGYMLLVSCAFFTVAGAIGFYACFWFVRTIYSSTANGFEQLSSLFKVFRHWLPHKKRAAAATTDQTKILSLSLSLSQSLVGRDMMRRIASSVFCFLLFITTANSFYFAGVGPSDYRRGDPIQLKVNKLLSTKTQLPYDYYFLRYCRPSKIETLAENLGEVLRGDHNSYYQFRTREDYSCSIACRIRLDAQAAKDFKEKIDDEYRVNMILDDLPVVVSRPSLGRYPSKNYEHGLRVGFKGRSRLHKQYYIFNHLSFTVMYNRDVETDDTRIVGFEVTPHSIAHEFDWGSGSMNVSTCNRNTKNMIGKGVFFPQAIAEGEYIAFSYDVAYKESEIEWESRWNTYLLLSDYQIHLFSMDNSLLIMLIACGVVATVMIQTLYKDTASYNQLESGDEAHEETGWKLIHGDVFRLPSNLEMVCVCVGSGLQFLGTILVMMIFTFLGFLFPSNRRFLMTTMVLLWLLVSFISGYFSSCLYRMFDTTEWKMSALKSALLFPSVLLSSALIWGEMVLAILWFGVSAPLMFLGWNFGFERAATEAPVKTYKIPREIPKQPWYLNPVSSALIGGILPFVAVLVEFRFIQTFIWMNRLPFISGHLLVALVILLIMCAEIAVVLCYLQLRNEDYKWWPRAFFNGGSSALYLFVYSVIYLFSELGLSASAILYSGYMLLVSFAFFMAAGAVGFYATFWFVRTIYLSVLNGVGELRCF